MESSSFGGVVPSGILGIEWTDLGHPEFALLEMGTQRNTRLTSFVALLLFVAATPA